jgi:hypothetical protein
MSGINKTVIQNLIFCVKNGILFYQEIFVISFVQAFCILVSDYGLIWAEKCFNVPVTADNIYVVTDG